MFACDGDLGGLVDVGDVALSCVRGERRLNAGEELGLVLRQMEITESTWNRWRSTYGGMKAADAKELKELRVENARLKKLLAETESGQGDAQGARGGKMVTPDRRRVAVERLVDRFGVSQRRACRVVGQTRSAQRRPRSQCPVADVAYGEWLCRFARRHPRWGWRKAHGVAVREGLAVNPKRTLRLWRAYELQRPPQRRHKRRRLGDGTAAKLRAERPNHVWALDFQFDETAARRRLKLLNVIDEHTREALAIRVDHSIDADGVVDVVEAIAAARGAPGHLRMGQRPRVRRRRPAGLVRALRHRDCLYRARRAMGERPHRVVQRPAARRMPQHRGLRKPARSTRRHRGLATRLQPLPTTPITRRAHPCPVRCQPQTDTPDNHDKPTPITTGPPIRSPSSAWRSADERRADLS